MKHVGRILLLLNLTMLLVLVSCKEGSSNFVDLSPQVTLVTPADKATGIDISPSFTWEAVDPTKKNLKYDFYFGIDSTKLFLQKKGLTDTQYQLNEYKLRKDVTYYWKVIAKNGDDEGESNVWEFVSIPAPSAPILSTPANETFVRDALTLGWEEVVSGVGQVITYKVLLDDVNPPVEQIGTVIGETTFNYDATKLTDGVDYYWRVASTDGINESPSEVFKFKKLIPGSPDVPVLQSPANKSGLFNVTEVTLDWTDVVDLEGDAISYDVYLDTQSPPVALVSTENSSTYTASGLQLNTPYYWKVVAKDPSDNRTSSEHIWSFSILEDGAPSIPVITDLPNDKLPLDGKIEWAASENAISYDVYVGENNPPTTLVASDVTQLDYLVKNTEVPSDVTDIKTFYATVVAKGSDGKVSNSIPYEFSPEVRGTITDDRSGEVNVYKWVRLGTQVWLAENLKATRLNDGTPLSFLDNGPNTNVRDPNDGANKLFYDKHVILEPEYPPSWSETYGYVYSRNVADNQMIAPLGWRVAVISDIQTLQSYVPDTKDALNVEWHGGNDLYELNLVTAGFRYATGFTNNSGFRIQLERSRAGFWIQKAGQAFEFPGFEVLLTNYRYYDYAGSGFDKSFALRMVKDDPIP